MSNFLKKFITAIRGGGSEVGEMIIDANAIRILEQEGRDVDKAILVANNSLIDIKGKFKLAKQRVEALNSDISSWESKALAALNANQDGLAAECAERIAGLESQRDAEAEQAAQFGKNVDILQAQVIKAESQLKGLKQQTEMAKARDAVQKARVATAEATGGANGRVESAVNSLARIKQRQDEQDARFEAVEEQAEVANGGDLERRLQEAGIGGKTGGKEDVLARLKAKQAGGNAL
ncbi:MAG: PspA/IM30 family protein [Pseudomonas sp.]